MVAPKRKRKPSPYRKSFAPFAFYVKGKGENADKNFGTNLATSDGTLVETFDSIEDLPETFDEDNEIELQRAIDRKGTITRLSVARGASKYSPYRKW